MKTGTRAPEVTAAARSVIQKSLLFENHYLTALHDGRMTLEGFCRTQEQFFFAVEYYSRPIAALLSRISDPALRVDILRNLVEEHGDFKESAFHKNTFLDFLRTIGADPGRLRTAAIWPEVRAFNCVIAAACSLEEIGVGLGCLGLIELAFAGISASLGNGVLERGWVKRAELVHYSLHAELDLLHADGFFAAAEHLWKETAGKRAVLDGLELGAYAFGRLYHDLSRAAATPG